MTDRPARKQVKEIDYDKRPERSGATFNIWHRNWSGGDVEDDFHEQTKAEGRCNIERDSGVTRADRIPGSYFCLYFARGLCGKGKNCEYLHRLPTELDVFVPSVDCFGREKHSGYRDDMGGVGTFLRKNRTLYVGRIQARDNIAEIVKKHFSEWGKIEKVEVLAGRGVAFVTYENESNAQFAKEAMAHQSLDNNEVLNVRWSTLSTDPAALRREQEAAEKEAVKVVKRLLNEGVPLKKIKLDDKTKTNIDENETTQTQNHSLLNPVSLKALEGINKPLPKAAKIDKQAKPSEIDSPAQNKLVFYDSDSE
ncbi:hypothetical protein CANCADRAFT_3878 [Tortispora caseinolytica NRRL Y-17796]|uniref:Pre-mRNA-splicing factor CWC2 n=1 Tax=Tortispora caseinolytica NRRL Y-17796 TaxID=767744 RepID=A0A1E4TC76_9ASCO|nr:hypothetical protein CANCADRAFT_3878 [Tortispora caseinolytica NRRL Y-17796]